MCMHAQSQRDDPNDTCGYRIVARSLAGVRDSLRVDDASSKSESWVSV